MSFTHTLDSLQKNFVTNKLVKSLEKSITVTANNNTFTINPNAGSLFLLQTTNTSIIDISDLDQEYTGTGSVISILITNTNHLGIVSWPENIKWSDGSAPELAYKNLITLTKFDSNSDWYGCNIIVDNIMPPIS